MTRARAKAIQEKVNSLLSTLDLGTYLDGMLFTLDTLCVIKYIPHESRLDENKPEREEEEERSQPRPEEGGVPGAVLPPDTSGTTASTVLPSPGGDGTTGPTSSQRQLGGTTADHRKRYYRPSGTTALEQAVLPAGRSPSRNAEKSSGKST